MRLIGRATRSYPCEMDEKREFLRHVLATLAYRATRALEHAPEHFADFRGAGKRPVEILAHMGDLLHWSQRRALGELTWKDSVPGSWDAEKARFYAELHSYDDLLASDLPFQYSVEKLFQGHIADALTHVGQIAMLRRLAGCPIHGESFFPAEIAIGRLGPDQAPPKMPHCG